MSDDLEALLAATRAMTEEANATLADQQRSVTYGSYWVRFYSIEDRVVIFGYVEPLAEMEATERELGAGDEEAIYIKADTERRHQNGYMYGMCYSTLTVEGELGFTHRADLWPIDETLFAAAQEVEWDIDSPLFYWEHKAALAVAYSQYRTHIFDLAIDAERRATGGESE